MPTYKSQCVFVQEPPLVTADRYNDLVTQVENQKKYTNYLAEHIDKLINDKIESKKEEIFMTFYINVDGMTRQQSEQSLYQFTKSLSKETSNYKITNIILPVKNQPTKVEIVNPSITNGDIIKSFKDLVDTLDDNKYREIIENL